MFVSCLQEKATSEHIDKPGERDDTIPPEYRELLDSNEQVCRTDTSPAFCLFVLNLSLTVLIQVYVYIGQLPLVIE